MTDNGARAEIQRVERRLVRHEHHDSQAVAARQERDRIEHRIDELERLSGAIEGRLKVLEAQMAALTSSDVLRRVADLEDDAIRVLESRVENVLIALAALTLSLRAQLAMIKTLEQRIVISESRMENVMARLDSHDLGFATLSLDEEGKAALARMMRLGEKGRPIVPGEEGTSES